MIITLKNRHTLHVNGSPIRNIDIPVEILTTVRRFVSLSGKTSIKALVMVSNIPNCNIEKKHIPLDHRYKLVRLFSLPTETFIHTKTVAPDYWLPAKNVRVMQLPADQRLSISD